MFWIGLNDKASHSKVSQHPPNPLFGRKTMEKGQEGTFQRYKWPKKRKKPKISPCLVFQVLAGVPVYVSLWMLVIKLVFYPAPHIVPTPTLVQACGRRVGVLDDMDFELCGAAGSSGRIQRGPGSQVLLLP